MSKQIISLFFDSVFEFFASFENRNFTCRNFQRSFGFGIDAFTSLAVCNAEGAKTNQGNLSAFLEGHGDAFKYGSESKTSSLLGNAGVGRDLFYYKESPKIANRSPKIANWILGRALTDVIPA